MTPFLAEVTIPDFWAGLIAGVVLTFFGMLIVGARWARKKKGGAK